ncbi:MAG: hypothetical protein Q8O13_08055 [Candidatus Omnitrophota bacterium]|nr:hypothetical protein [Candidatus Omnitrophota bacterium]
MKKWTGLPEAGALIKKIVEDLKGYIKAVVDVQRKILARIISNPALRKSKVPTNITPNF